MKLSYLSAPHLLMIVVAVWFVLGAYLILRRCSDFGKRLGILLLALLNLSQHLLKGYVWPHMFGTGFSFSNTAYNICAILIYLTPFVFCSKLNVLKDSVMYIGTMGPSLTLLVPYWFQGQEFLQWEVLRFFVCHVLLVATSLLPLLLGLHRPSSSRALLVPIGFFGMLAVILFNDYCCCLSGVIQTDDIFATLSTLNPCWTMHPAPPQGFEFAARLLEAFSPSFLLGNAERPYVPILWYAVPMYILIFALAYVVGRGLEALEKRRVPLLKPLAEPRPRRA